MLLISPKLFTVLREKFNERGDIPMATNNPLVIITHGPPLSGKSCLAKFLAEECDLPFFESGPFLKARLGAEKLKRVNSGELAQTGDFTKIVIPHLEELIFINGGYVAAGTGRMLSEAKALIEQVLFYTGLESFIVFQLCCSSKTLENRRLKRQVIEGRLDDDQQSFVHRLRVYEEQTLDVLDFYRSFGCLVEIDANHSMEKVRAQALDCLHNRKLIKSPA